MKAPVELVSVGNIVVDFPVGPLAGLPGWGTLAVVPNRLAPAIGGNGAIFAVAAARLGIRCELVGKVGRDFLGDWLLGALTAEQVGTAMVKRGAKGTSSTIALVSEGGERAFLHYPGSSGSLAASDLKAIPMCKWLHFSSMFLLPGLSATSIAAALKAARKAGATTSLDVAWDPEGNWEMGGCLEQADYFMPNLDEARAISGEENVHDVVRRLAAMGAKNVVVKMGAGGSFVFGIDCREFEAPAFSVSAVDSTGAGDVFDAALVYALKNGMDLRKAALLANAAGALKVTAYGGTAAAPTSKELLDFIRERRTND